MKSEFKELIDSGRLKDGDNEWEFCRHRNGVECITFVTIWCERVCRDAVGTIDEYGREEIIPGDLEEFYVVTDVFCHADGEKVHECIGVGIKNMLNELL